MAGKDQTNGEPILSVRNLHVNVGDQEILKGINLTVNAGEVHAIMGPNGSGKSTLANVLAGKPEYIVTAGEMVYKGKDLSRMAPELRAREGLFLAFQYPVELPGVRAWQFLKAAVDALRLHQGQEEMSARAFDQMLKEKVKLVEIDPDNRLLARQSALCLEAEFIRDTALALSGLLNREIGGRSVRPYQPEAYWENLNFPKRTYEHDTGDKQYRRGLYTHWQRSFLHPSLYAFDAPSREECVAQRPISNTPLQALVLLNDPTYVEAARKFAERIMTEGGAETAERVVWAFKQAVSRVPTEEESRILEELFLRHFDVFAQDRQAAEKVLETGLADVAEGLEKTELAAWTSIARVILNLHETITRA